MVVATPRLPFRCAIPWESRQWQPWERFLFGALGRRKNLLALTALALMMPIAIAVSDIISGLMKHEKHVNTRYIIKTT